VTCARNSFQSEWIEAGLKEKLIRETSYHFLEEAPRADSIEHGEAIGLRRIDCPWCGWKMTDPYSGKNDRMIVLPIEGDTTGVQIRRHEFCRCRLYEKFYTRWSGPTGMVPVAYRKFQLNKIAPSELSLLRMQDQEDTIALLKMNPGRSCLLVGPAQTSKTVYTTGLFSWALKNWTEAVWGMAEAPEAVWRITAKEYLKQEHNYEISRERRIVDADGNVTYAKPQEPLVTRDKVKDAVAAGFVPRLFLEEIDKVPDMTAFRSSNLFGLVNEVIEQAGKVVVNSNKTVAGLKAFFGEDNGEPLIRRFTGSGDESKGFFLDFHNSRCVNIRSDVTSYPSHSRRQERPLRSR